MSLQTLKTTTAKQIKANVAATAAQSQAKEGSATEEALETLAKTKAEAAKGDQQAVKKLAKIAAAAASKLQAAAAPAKAQAPQEGGHIDIVA